MPSAFQPMSSPALSKPHAALVIIGHGSTLNPDSSTPTHQHADAIRRQGIFAEVACAFWKEEPSMREVYAMIESPEVYLVPNFISEGYFCQQVLPRELQVTGPITQLADKTLYYCDPVGIHPNMTKLLLQRADEVAHGVPRDQTALIIVGHGTSLNENSRKVIEQQVALIRDGGYGFAEVVDAYMEEKPLVSEWHELTRSPNVVVVPFFIADGLHSYQDIPVLLGFETETGAAASQREVFRHNPHHLHGRSLYYSSAIGTEPHMADVILDQVIDFDRKHQPSAQSQPADPKIIPWLRSKLVEGRLRIGQIQIEAQGSGFVLRHSDDAEAPALTAHHGALALREIVKLDAQGEFRALKSAPNLVRGWHVIVDSLEELLLALDIAYPAAAGMAMAEEQGKLQGVPLRSNLSRQTGMYRFTNTIRDDQAMEMVASCCDSAMRCQRRIVWGLTADQPLSGPATIKEQRCENRGEIPLLCMEVCPLLVSEARKIAQKNHAEKQAASGS